ncbi:MAG: signal peptidase I [Alphaproteobacteria bacterium]|nr:signal peptidase I [Alphaproteobacteria bacterium]
MVFRNSSVSDKKAKGGLLESIKTVVYAVLIALFVRTVAYEPFNIPSGSMIPTLLIGDYLFVSKFSYGYSRYSLPFGLPLFSGRVLARAPERGDVAVFKYPRDNKTDYIKRIVGLPGDRLQMKGGVLQINGEPVKRRRVEDFVERSPFGGAIRFAQYVETLPNGRSHRILEITDDGPFDNTGEYVVPPGHYFAMGDNRDNSADSRDPSAVGFVPAENLVGRAEFLFFSTDGSAALWQFWRWPLAIRWNRLFDGVG